MRAPILIIAGSLAAALVLACGDGEPADPSATATTGDTSGATIAPDAAPTLDAPPTREGDAVALIVVAGDRNYQPTVSEFATLPQTESAGQEGVTLADLAAKVGVEGDAVVTVEGRSQDLGAIRYWRGSLEESGSDLVIGIDDGGLAFLAGEALEENAWLYAVESVVFE